MVAAACETFCPCCESAFELFANVERKLRTKSWDSRLTLLMLGLSIELQRGNAAFVVGSLQRDEQR